MNDLMTALRIVREVYEQLPAKTEEQRRVKSNLACAAVYLEDEMSRINLLCQGIKPEFLADEILQEYNQ